MRFLSFLCALTAQAATACRRGVVMEPTAGSEVLSNGMTAGYFGRTGSSTAILQGRLRKSRSTTTATTEKERTARRGTQKPSPPAREEPTYQRRGATRVDVRRRVEWRQQSAVRWIRGGASGKAGVMMKSERDQDEAVRNVLLFYPNLIGTHVLFMCPIDSTMCIGRSRRRLGGYLRLQSG